MKRLFSLLVLVAAAAPTLGSARAQAFAQTAATPPPPPPPLSSPAPPAPTLPPGTLPAVTPTPPPIDLPPGTRTPGPASATPAAQTGRVGISGVWEVQIQRESGTTYTHFKLQQSGDVLTGEYLDSNGKKYPLAGSVENQNVRIVVSKPDGTTITFSGTQDNGTDMLGMMQTPKASIAFTAAYRPKYKWLENINPGTGLGGVP